MFRKFIAILVLLFCAGWTNEAGKKNRIELVFCLDLSGSTNGLLDDIRDNLWHLINFVQAASPETDFKLGAIGFSRPIFGSQSDYVTILSDLTHNYDFLSCQLYGLTASVEKGDQYLGSALHSSISYINWSKDPETKKIILVFGNGRADMGRYDYRKAIDLAIEKNIIVYPVYCVKQNMNPKDLPAWNGIAERTGGEMNTIVVTKREPIKRISADAEWLTETNNELNDTYITYNKEGSTRYNELISADINSLAMNEQFFYARCRYKTSDHFQEQCAQWDLASFIKNNPSDTPNINRKYLSENSQETSIQELFAVAKLKLERREIILDKMKNKFTELNTDSLAINPIDSIIFKSIVKLF